MNNGATFSEDRKHRFALWRIWNEDKPLVMFIGLNPSTASEKGDDNTIRRVIRYAYSWGFGGLYMMNLFTYITPYPRELEHSEHLIAENDRNLLEIREKCEMVVFMWGSFKQARMRAAHAKTMFPGAYCFRQTLNGSPFHPLYLKSGLKPIPFIYDCQNA
jgi:hypothetical protein